jgi:hypothetical protein
MNKEADEAILSKEELHGFEIRYQGNVAQKAFHSENGIEIETKSMTRSILEANKQPPRQMTKSASQTLVGINN